MAVSETSQSERRTTRLRRWRTGVLVAATAVSVLMVLLVFAAWRNDHLISSDKVVATGEVLSAGRLRSAVVYVTPDGVTHNPKVGILYPTNLTAGERIKVEYSRSDPDLVRVAGRDARVAIIPALSVIVVTWLIALPIWWLLVRGGRRDREGGAGTGGSRAEDGADSTDDAVVFTEGSVVSTGGSVVAAEDSGTGGTPARRSETGAVAGKHVPGTEG